MSGDEENRRWEAGFPAVFGHSSVAFLMACPGFAEAKHGDFRAARAVAERCVKPERLALLRELYPEAVLLPLITENMLPLALARQIGLRVHTEVSAHGNLSRKSMSAMERLLHRPKICGTVRAGESYIIVEDIVTQGGTVSALREHIIAGGGKVLAVTALALSAGSGRLVPEESEKTAALEKFGERELGKILEGCLGKGDLGQLTRSELRYICRFKSEEALLTKILNARGTLAEKEAARAAVRRGA